MTRGFEIRPEPPPSERDAVLAAVRAVLDREAAAAKPAMWTLSGWVYRRTGYVDLGPRLGPHAWRLSARLPAGGREYPGLIGRGDAR